MRADAWREFYEQRAELVGVLERNWERYGALARCFRPAELCASQINDVFRYARKMEDWCRWGLDALWERDCTPTRLTAVEKTLLAEGVIRKYGEWRGSLALYG